MKEKALERARKVFEIESQAILNLINHLDASFAEAVDIVSTCKGKVILTGIGKSGQIARKISSTFSSTGTPSVYLHPAESSHGDLGLIMKEDVVIAISYGGGSPELSTVISYVTRQGIPLIGMTGNKDSELAQRSQLVLNVKVEQEACPLGLAPTSSTTATLAMGDALAMAVLEEKGFTTEDFAQFHPGGVLGFKLTRVKDLMLVKDQVPVLPMEASLKQVLSVMSQGSTRGAAGILDSKGNLAGIITDGGIRRCLEETRDLLGGRADSLMTKNPRTIDANDIVEKALHVMEEFRINVLFVLDKNSSAPKKPVGIIHIQDLIKSKVR